MKKILPTIALTLSLAARSLSANPLESVILEETKKDYDLTASIDNKSFVVDASLPMGKDWRINFASDMEYDDERRTINSLDLALGNKHFYIGASYGDLTADTLLQDSSIAKVETGFKPFDWLDFSVSGSLVNLPEMKVVKERDYQTPLQLYALGWNANVGKEFGKGQVKFFPWLSVTGSRYWAVMQQTEDLQALKTIYPDYSEDMINYAFDHFNVKAGLDIKAKLLDLIYQGEYEGQFFYPPFFNISNTLGISMHDEERKSNAYYNVTLITKPQFYKDIANKTRNELKFDMGGFGVLDSGFFLKGQFSTLVDFLSPNQMSFLIAAGKRFKEGNLELYYNSQSNTIGLMYSNQLDTSTKRESKSREPFNKLEKNSPMDYSSSSGELHKLFGETLEEAVAYVKAHGEQGLSDIISHIQYKEHIDGTFSAREEYEAGWGDCEDTNGNLIPYIESRAFNYREVYAVSLTGSFTNHAITIIRDQNGKFDLRNYSQYYDLNAESEKEAIQKVFPGAYVYGDATVSSTVSKVREAVERPLYDWNRFQ